MLAAVLYCIQSTQYYYAFLGLHSFTVYFINSVEFHSFWHILYRIVKYYLVFISSTMFIIPWYFKSMLRLFFFFKTREMANKGGKKETSFSYRNCHRVWNLYYIQQWNRQKILLQTPFDWWCWPNWVLLVLVGVEKNLIRFFMSA